MSSVVAKHSVSAMHTYFLFQQMRILCYNMWTCGKKGELYILATVPLSSADAESTDILSLFRISVFQLLVVMFVLPIAAACLAWKKHVSFFAIIRYNIFCIDVTVADNHVIFSYVDYIISICCDDLVIQKSKQFSFVYIAPKESVPWIRRS